MITKCNKKKHIKYGIIFSEVFLFTCLKTNTLLEMKGKTSYGYQPGRINIE
jgi:hypothetical protein